MNNLTKVILLIALLFSCCHNISFPQLQRNSVLEVSEGTWGSWASCGHAVIEQILNIMPNAVILGYHGPANGSDPFSFFPGNEIIDLLTFYAYPTGVIDRTSPPRTRDLWLNMMSQRFNIPATVNISTEGVFDTTTRQLDITIHLTALGNLSGSYQMNIILVEDSLIHSQAGNFTCPGGNDYVHNNVVRDMINGAYGEELNGVVPWNTGETISKNIQYVVPSNFNGARCNLVIFVYKEHSLLYLGEMQQAIKVPLTNSSLSSLILLLPNGGEIWEVGTLENITWHSTGINNVTLNYSTDSGNTWTEIVGVYPAGNGQYEWLIPDTPSGFCKIKINDETNTNFYDLSDQIFTITSPPLPSITVITPNGGEVWAMGQMRDITWTSTAVTDVKLELSINDGATWTTIIDSTPSDGVYNWEVQVPSPSMLCLIKVVDLADETNFDVSDDVFQIDILPSVNEEFRGIPKDYTLIQNYPNPFNPVTKIYYGVPQTSYVELTVFDLLGNEIVKLISNEKVTGYHSVDFDASNYNSGIYFYRLQAGDFIETKKMVLIK